MATLPEQVANFEEIGPENDVANFPSVHLTKPYSVNMAEPQQTKRYSSQSPEKTKASGFLIFATGGLMRTLP